MKLIPSLVFSLVLAAGLAAQETSYSILKVCQDDLVIHTTDGADAGHIGYLVLDPDGQRVVSVMVTGGVLAERYVSLPASSFRYGASREVTLESVTRETLISAPAIDRQRFSTTMRIEPSVIQQSQTHFHVTADRRDVRTDSVRDQRDTTSRTTRESQTLNERRDGNNLPSADSTTRTRDGSTTTRDGSTTTRDASTLTRDGNTTRDGKTTRDGNTDTKKHTTPGDDKKSPDATPDKGSTPSHDGNATKGDHKGPHAPDATPAAHSATDSTQPDSKKHNPAADDRKPGENKPGNEKAKPSTRDAGDQSGAGEKKGAAERSSHSDAAKEKPAKEKGKGADDDDKPKKVGGRGEP